MDEIFEKANIDFPGGLISLLVYPNDFHCAIHKNYATYSCRPGMPNDKKYETPETIIALTQEGAEEIIEKAEQKLSELQEVMDEGINIKNKQAINNQIQKVKQYLDRNRISDPNKPLSERINQIGDFRPEYNSWDFLYENKDRERE